MFCTHLMCMYMPDCMYVYLCVCSTSGGQQGALDLLELGLHDCKMPGYWKLNRGPLPEHPVL